MKPSLQGRGRKLADIRFEEAEARRVRYLELVNEGLSRHEARVQVGWSASALTYNRKKFPSWAASVDHALTLVAHLGPAVPGEGMSTPGSFPEFVQKWFPDRRAHLPHQIEIASKLQTLRPRDIVMFLLWPEAGKTSTLEDYICRKLAFDPSHRFRYVSEAQDLSKRVVGTCKRRFTDTSAYGPYIARYGPFFEKGQERDGRPWTTEQIMVRKNPGGERDYNLVASSWSSAVYGSRIDTLILDDVQTQRNYGQAEEIFRRIRGTFFNRGLEMRTLIIGTRIGPGDLYERMEDAGLITERITKPAMNEQTGEPTIPQFWKTELTHDGGPCCSGFRECPRDGTVLSPKEYMEVIRHQSGEDTWQSSYQQNPVADSLSSFGEFLPRCLDHERNYGPLLVV